jgi:hypothetical protein
MGCLHMRKKIEHRAPTIILSINASFARLEDNLCTYSDSYILQYICINIFSAFVPNQTLTSQRIC